MHDLWKAQVPDMNYTDKFEKLREIYSFPKGSGVVETYMPAVRFFWATEPVPRAPLLYDSGLILIGQGHKIGHLNGTEFRYDKDHYLITSVPTALECETHASPDCPILGIFVDIDTSNLHRLIEKVEKHSSKHSFDGRDVFCGVEPATMSDQMKQAAERLLDCLQSPLDCEVLGPSLVDEIVYRALLGEHGKALAALTMSDTYHARIALVLSHIHERYMASLSVDELAEQANMSASSFHRAFKTVTGESPLQYLKKVRLNKARFLITREGLRVGTAANQVGYESVSQFSREFKRYFQVPPSAAANGPYADMFR